ncbi:hypothetical protein L227DRAFT_299431 [Lentinus tigrinus ALCF2SS1-6]|uniref:Uncharacterized protein n=1 Tax=Lentinus tigrinus ALCF2SS1-6 TaxID=1328759 RepID=A0A5C2RXE2_9APHY|nr:hypothetical protein L227DRAFT_299431 [Lentinus tigrinus ALCF2SS1-6]
MGGRECAMAGECLPAVLLVLPVHTNICVTPSINVRRAVHIPEENLQGHRPSHTHDDRFNEVASCTPGEPAFKLLNHDDITSAWKTDWTTARIHSPSTAMDLEAPVGRLGVCPDAQELRKSHTDKGYALYRSMRHRDRAGREIGRVERSDCASGGAPGTTRRTWHIPDTIIPAGIPGVSVLGARKVHPTPYALRPTHPVSAWVQG